MFFTFFFFFNDTATTEIYTLSLHDALPIWAIAGQPEYVGVIVTVTAPSASRTSRKMPRSAMVRAGNSGSGTDPAVSLALTMSRPGWRARRFAARRGDR